MPYTISTAWLKPCKKRAFGNVHLLMQAIKNKKQVKIIGSGRLTVIN
jgi:hypothetical protein